MKTATNANKKFIITIAVLLVAMIGLLSALIGVLATNSISLDQSFLYGFDVGENVAAKVKLSYKVGNGAETIPSVVGSGGANYTQDADGYITIDTTTSGSASGSPSVENISLTKDSSTVTFIFEVQDILEGTNSGGQEIGLMASFSVTNSSNYTYTYWEKGGNQSNASGAVETDSDGFVRYTTPKTSNVDLGSTPIYYKIILTLNDFNSEVVDESINVSMTLTQYTA
ncbi:MAG: hypothetical protein IJX25_03115 [Clostridia bacterium]|nr:hypothetical protein [Clostridia bacterium]